MGINDRKVRQTIEPSVAREQGARDAIDPALNVFLTWEHPDGLVVPSQELGKERIPFPDIRAEGKGIFIIEQDRTPRASP